MALYNTSNSSLVGTYTYDTWGRVTSVKDATGTDVSGIANHILNLNSFRYRGYYYDRETGFYYLQSRYYDPETGRFLNADGLISTGTGVAGYNMYMYCNNNPVNGWDPTGTCYKCAHQFWQSYPRPVWTYNSGGYGYETYSIRLKAWQRMYSYFLYMEHPKPSPVKDPQANDGYGARSQPSGADGSPVSNSSTQHPAIDLVSGSGDSTIYAVEAGFITFAGLNSGYGNQIQHQGSYYTYHYSHLSSMSVKEGDYVVAGQPIGIIGNTGLDNMNVHLDFKVWEPQAKEKAWPYLKFIDPSKVFDFE